MLVEINAETFRSIIQLSSFVSSAPDEREAIELARSFKGVKSVKNVMLVK